MVASMLSTPYLHKPLGCLCGCWPGSTKTARQLVCWAGTAPGDQPSWLSSLELEVISAALRHLFQELANLTACRGLLAPTAQQRLPHAPSNWEQEGSRASLAEFHAQGNKLVGLRLTLVRFHLYVIKLVAS